jgi:predicted regulator of Ras-like GTPase activity (Roadblock/LC7/MglB family)
MNSPQAENKWDVLQKRVTVTPAQQLAIEKIGVHLKTQTPALFVLITDRNGQIVYFSGEVLQQSGLVELAALLAGDLAASQEIARLTGTYQHQQLILREGEKQNSFLSEAGHDLVLFMQTMGEVPLGWARLLIQEAGGRLAELVLRSSDKEMEDQINFDGFEKNLNEAVDGLWS